MPDKKFTPKKATKAPDPDPVPEYSDAKYILVLFILALIVVVFGVLIFIFSNSPINGALSGKQRTDDLADAMREAESYMAEEEIILPDDFGDDVEVIEVEEVTLIDEEPSADIGEKATTISRSFTLPADFDPARYNPRSDATRALYGRNLIQRYFLSINEGNYKEACSLTSNTICNARRDIFAFENFLKQIKNGFDLISIYEADEQKDDEKIYCVQYTYELVADLNPAPITEVFQYRVRMRPDGADEISARVCEKVMKNGKERPCPIKTPKKYCDA